MLTKEQRKVAILLFDMGAIKFGAFRLKLHEKDQEAPLSPIYVDLRVIRSFPQHYSEVVGLYLQLLRNLRFDYLADVPTAATPIVTLLAERLRKPMLSPRLEEKKHGIIRPIDGVFQKGRTAVLVDDLITSADSKLHAIQVLEENQLSVKDVVVLVDREQNGAETLRKNGYNCHAAFQLSQLLRFYAKIGKITEEQKNKVLSYLGLSGGS